MASRLGVVALHPESVPGDSATLRWVVADLAPPFVGPVGLAPGDLGRLMADGTLAAVALEPGAVVITLAGGPDWRAAGPTVRTALHAALLQLGGWVAVGGSGGEPVDVSVARAVRAALVGEAGAFVRSHGGVVELVGVCDGVVTLRLSGSCAGCPAIGVTLGRRLEGQLRQACPLVREVRAVA
jgi:Fe-S cluster biogenesis protein NfuA